MILQRPAGQAQLNWLRDWLIFSFFVDMPPMRPQNAHLQVSVLFFCSFYLFICKDHIR